MKNIRAYLTIAVVSLMLVAASAFSLSGIAHAGAVCVPLLFGLSGDRGIERRQGRAGRHGQRRPPRHRHRRLLLPGSSGTGVSILPRKYPHVVWHADIFYMCYTSGFFSNSSATSIKSWRMGRCWGHASSHRPHFTQSDALCPERACTSW